MAVITSAQQTALINMYVGLYGKAPSAATLTTLTAGFVAAGSDIYVYAKTLATDTGFSAQFAGKVTAAAQAATIAANFGMTDLTTTTAVGYHVNAWLIDTITNTTLTLSEISAVVGEFLRTQTHLATDTVWADSYNLMQNKTEVAEYYAATVQGSTDSSTVLATVTASDATVVTAKAAASSTAGSTYTLTTAVDTFTGTSGNDTFIGDAATITTADQVDGGAGTDTMKVYDLAAQSDIPTLSNVEIVELIGSTVNVDLSAVSAMTALVVDNATSTNNITIAAPVTVTVKNMATAGVESLTITTAATDTTSDLTVSAAGTSAGDLTIDTVGAGITTLNVTSTGSTKNYLTLTASTGTETTANFSGATALDAGTLNASVVTVNASAMTAAFDVTMGVTTTATAITGGSGNDTVNTATAAVNYTIDLGAGDDYVEVSNLTVNDSVVGGTGTDTLAMTEADAAALDGGAAAEVAILAKVTGFEKLALTDDLDGSAIVIGDLGYNQLVMKAATTADTTVSGFTTGATITKSDVTSDGANTAIVVGMTGATNASTPNDTLNITLAANLTAAQTSTAATTAASAVYGVNALVRSNFDVAGINIINVVASDSNNTDAATNKDDGYVLDLEDDAAGSNSANITEVNISGSASVMYNVEAATTALTKVDATNATGIAIINADAFAGTQGVTLTGGSQNDSLIGSDLADIIIGGAGADLIDGGNGNDTLTGGTGADIFYFASEAGASTELTGAPSATVFDTITDFEKGVDVIALHDEDATIASEVNVNITIVQNATAATGTAAINAEGVATFAAADDTLAEMITAVEAAIQTGAAAAGQMAYFEFSGSSYVFISDGTDGVDANDTFIKLSGVTGLSDSTITAGDLVIA